MHVVETQDVESPQRGGECVAPLRAPLAFLGDGLEIRQRMPHGEALKDEQRLLEVLRHHLADDPRHERVKLAVRRERLQCGVALCVSLIARTMMVSDPHRVTPRALVDVHQVGLIRRAAKRRLRLFDLHDERRHRVLNLDR